jgi:hypothetical protein
MSVFIYLSIYVSIYLYMYVYTYIVHAESTSALLRNADDCSEHPNGRARPPMLVYDKAKNFQV